MRTATAPPTIPVGATLNNGFDNGGARFYPWSRGLALTPNAQFSKYIGPASGNPVVPPIAALQGTTGTIGAGVSPSDSHAVANPFGGHSPLPWIIGGLTLAVVVMYHKGYKGSKS